MDRSKIGEKATGVDMDVNLFQCVTATLSDTLLKNSIRKEELKATMLGCRDDAHLKQIIYSAS